MHSFESNLHIIRERIAEAARHAGRESNSISLLAVSKKHPVEVIRNAWDAGQKVFGESRVQEALAKIPLLPSNIEWQFIGHLQTNKIRKALPHFSLFHGVDSYHVAQQMDRIAAEIGAFPRILLEVNLAKEATKFGFTPEKLQADFDKLLTLPRVQVVGLMTITPYFEEVEKTRPIFSKLYRLREELEKRGGVPLPELSMGMSGDFECAIKEGATIVRIGSALFGDRPLN